MFSLSRRRSPYEDRYKVVRTYGGDLTKVCFYCGEPADTFDHVPPISRVSDYESLNLKTESYLKVFSCAECNRYASDTLQDSIVERHAYIKEKIAIKRANVLKIPNWSNAELRKLGKKLASSIKADLALKERTVKRINYTDSLNEYLDSICLENA